MRIPEVGRFNNAVVHEPMTRVRETRMSKDSYPPNAHETTDARTLLLSVPFLAEHLPVGIVIEDAAHTVCYTNTAFHGLFSLSDLQHFNGMESQALIAELAIHAAQPSLFSAQLLPAAASDRTTYQRHSLHDGRVLKIDTQALLTDTAAFQGRLWVFEDITEHHKLDESLSAATRQLERMATYAPISLFELDTQGRVTAIEGRTVARLPDSERAELTGKLFAHFATGQTPEQRARDFNLLAGGHEVESHLELDPYTLQIRLSPMMNAQGALERIFGVALDVTERHRVENALRQSEAAYVSIMESLEDGYYELDHAGDLTVVNEALCRMFGYTRAQMLSDPVRHVIEFMVVDQAQSLVETFRQVYRTGQPCQAFEASIRRRDGRTVMIEMSITLTYDSQGRRIGYRGIARDITARKRTEAMLNRRMTLLGILQQVNYDLNQTLDMDIVLSVALNAGIVLSEADAGFIGMLEGDHLRLVRSIGYSERIRPERLYMPLNERVIGRVIRQRVGELVTDVSADPDYITDVASTRAQIAMPLFSQDVVIGVLNLETTTHAHFNQEVFEFVNVLTARINAAIDNARLYAIAQTQLAELRSLNVQLRELEEMKTDMIRIAAHDLKTPLSIVTGYIGVLREDLTPHLDSLHQSFFDKIERSLERISRMSTDILSLERITSQPSDRLMLADLRDLTREAATDQVLGERTLSLNLPDQPVIVRCDRANLLEAIYNLVTNAIKYTPGSGKIAVCMGLSDARAWLEIEDTGYGIPDEMQERLFQAFYRATTEMTDHVDGTGLGLYLVKRIVDEHGGKIRFHSQLGVGSMFGFDLPLAEQEGDEVLNAIAPDERGDES